MHIFSFPIRQSIAQSNVLFRIYEEAKETQDDEVKFDLFKTKSLTPFGIIMLTATITECQRMGKKCYYKRPSNIKLSNFLDEIGFHKHFHIDGQEPIPDQIQTGRVQLKRISGLDPFFIETMTDIFDHHLNISRGVKGFCG